MKTNQFLLAKNIQEIENFLQGNKIKIIYIASPTCTTCQAIFPKILQTLEKFNFVEICRAEISTIPSVGARFGVFSAPTILVLYQNKEFYRFDRYIRMDIFEEKIQFLGENIQI